MSADHADGVAGLPLAADGEGDNRGAVARQIVLAARLDDRSPVIALANELEAGLLKQGGRSGYGMVGCRECGEFTPVSSRARDVELLTNDNCTGNELEHTSGRGIDKVEKAGGGLGRGHPCSSR